MIGTCTDNSLNSVIVSRARLLHVGEESGQILINSCLTRQEFLGVFSGFNEGEGEISFQYTSTLSDEKLGGAWERGLTPSPCESGLQDY